MRDRMTTASGGTPDFDMAAFFRSMAALESRPGTKPLDGRVVVVDDNEAVVDPHSGAMYVTRKAWDSLRKAIPETTTAPASPEGPAGG